MTKIGSIAKATLLLSLAFAASTSSCGKCTSKTASRNAKETDQNASVSVGHCTALGPPLRFGDGERDASNDRDLDEGAPVPFAPELGSAVGTKTGFFVGVRSGGREGGPALLTIPLNAGALTVLPKLKTALVNVGSVVRPPLVAVDVGGDRFAGVLSVSDDQQAFDVAQQVGGNGPFLPFARIVEDADESEANAMMVSNGKVWIAWDDADSLGERGRIRLRVRAVSDPEKIHAVGDGNGRGRPPRASPSNSTRAIKPAASADRAVDPDDVVSPRTSDASRPTFVVSNDFQRAVLLWIAERPEQAVFTDGGAGEPSQAETFRWVEGVELDLSTGRPRGVPHALTAMSGHVQSFAAILGIDLVMAVRDDPRPNDSDGGELVALNARFSDGAITIGAQYSVAKDDVAPGIPVLIARNKATPSEGAYVAYLTRAGHARFVPVFTNDAALRATTEDALHGHRIVGSFGERILASRLVGRSIVFLVASCSL
ncbi:MAG: hypothetical protein NVS3B20_16950 [Polyangiales bacterium]